MTIRWNDIITTLLAVAALAIFYAESFGYTIPYIGDPRIMATVLGLLGVAVWAAGSTELENLQDSVATWGLGLLGVATILTAGWGIMASWVLAGPILLAIIVGMWAVSTVRHAVF